LKILGYYYDLSFNAFLYPNPKDTRRLLSFLLEFISKNEEEGKHDQQAAPSQQFDVLLKRRLQAWTEKPWIMPHFLKQKKQVFLSGGDTIQVREDIDQKRIEECKSKKAKGVYELMKTLKAGRIQESYQNSQGVLGLQLNKTGWRKGIRLQEKSQHLLRDEDEDMEMGDGQRRKRGGKEMKSKAMESLMKTVEQVQNAQTRGGQTQGTAFGMGEDTAQATVSLREMLEEREAKMKEEEQMQGNPFLGLLTLA